ncbi:hypothetical protein [Paenibacillus sp. Y412MC10]|nr:hypothetical protein [Paenibacillus sp. Y412MC10]
MPDRTCLYKKVTKSKGLRTALLNRSLRVQAKYRERTTCLTDSIASAV